MIIKISSLGNLGNRMIQYISALNISKLLNAEKIVNVKLPEWNILIDDIEINNMRVLCIDDYDININKIKKQISEKSPDIVYFTGYLQNYNIFLDLDICRSIFPKTIFEEDEIIYDDEILVPIRSGELLEGLYQYPLIPVDFYKKLSQKTGKKLVFMGQIGNDGYSYDITNMYSECRFIKHRSIMHDFEIIRNSKNIFVGISTFSYIASWLSVDSNIFIALWGFFNPVCFRGIIELLPLDDQRYTFFLMPYIIGIPEVKIKILSEKISSMSYEINSREIINIYDRLNKIELSDYRNINFDDKWYLSRYLDASLAISEGKYFDAIDHFLKKGIWEGYLTNPPSRRNGKNISIGKIAKSSSFTEYASGKNNQSQASNAVNGKFERETAFHTELEDRPWWNLDLGVISKIEEVNIFNRSGCVDIQIRSIPLYVYVSLDNKIWYLIHVENELFGGYPDNYLVIHCYPYVVARYLKIEVHKKTFLHLDQVQVFGENLY